MKNSFKPNSKSSKQAETFFEQRARYNAITQQPPKRNVVTTANIIMREIVAQSPTLNGLQTMAAINQYGEHLNDADAFKVLKILSSYQLVTIEDQGQWQVKHDARTHIIETPKLSWDQGNCDLLKRFANPSYPSNFEEYTTLQTLANIEIDHNQELRFKDIEQAIKGKKIKLTSTDKKNLMKWLIKEGFIERADRPNTFILTNHGRERARKIIEEFSQMKSPTIISDKSKATIALPTLNTRPTSELLDEEFLSPKVSPANLDNQGKISVNFKIKSKNETASYNYSLTTRLNNDESGRVLGVNDTTFIFNEMYKGDTTIPGFQMGILGHSEMLSSIEKSLKQSNLRNEEKKAVLNSLRSESGIPKEIIVQNVENGPVISSLNSYFNEAYKLNLSKDPWFRIISAIFMRRGQLV